MSFFLSLVASVEVQAQSSAPANSLIIQLKAGAQSEFSRELPSAAHAKRESLAHERMSAVAQGAGVKGFAHRQLTGDHRLMRFTKPLHGRDLEDTMRRLRLHPDVASVEPNVRVPLAQVPNDPNFAQQWHLGSRASAAAALNMSSTWAITTGTSAITVAVLDTGVLRNHPDLVAMGSRLLSGYDFVGDVDFSNDNNGRDANADDPGDWVTTTEAGSILFSQLRCKAENSSWHGTFIAGQIAAATNNNLGVSGLNWNVKILPVRVSGKCGAELSDIVDGMRWAAGLPVDGVPLNLNPAKVINLSFGGDSACTSSYQSVIDELAARGTLVVVAAGNGLDQESRQLKRPADCRGVMAVGAVQRDGLKTAYSFLGSNMALMTTGGHGGSTTTLLISTDNDGLTSPNRNGYGYKAGTSFSAPLAAGVASLMLAVNPNLSPDALIARMKAAALPHVNLSGLPSCSSDDSVACNCNTSVCGAGLLNPQGALEQSVNPAAVIAAVGSPGLGATVVLDGRASTAVGTPTISSYSWSQISGAARSLPNASSSLTQVVLPSTPGDFVFQLIVTDTLGRNGTAQLFIGTALPAAAVSSSAGGGGGGGADQWLWLTLLGILVFSIPIHFLKKNRRLPAYLLRKVLSKQ
ncbi:S8 family peptidase [Variovorax sp. PCZ-1]|uniref:S8 family peptidase n=1 Tax=Variovorax sp. PCZ-1 TaxID=2835533 RepID=UPI001BCB6873|nr:S8 family peptidase [Variovorax sp. PCZ-1]MBS7808896.1 S8 family peptidase [Variovorax sp. PCZ-1]